MRKIVLILLLLTGWVRAESLQVLPPPREVKMDGTGFAPETARYIIVSDNAEDRFAGRLVREAILDTHGVDCEMVLSTNAHCLALATTKEIRAAQSSTNGNEGYILRSDPEGISVAAETDAGIFYGAQTLIQLLEQSRREKRPVPGMVINDRPQFGWRARYFDASQYFGSIVVTRANLEHEIKTLARYKLNWLCFDAYNYVPFKSFPACANANTLSLQDWEYLVDLAHRYHVTLVPSLQSFGQIYDVIWRCDEGKPYRESTAPGLICPSRPENVQFLQGLYRDLISIFKYSPVLGIGCSEVGMQWDKKYCPLCRERIAKGESEHDIFCKHVRDCVHAVDAAAKEAGRSVRPMMWGDEFYMGYGGQRWVGIEMIPTNTVMGHWMYWKPYDGIEGLLQRGYDVVFLSASYQHNTYLVDLSPQEPVDGKWAPLLEGGIRNVTDQAIAAANADAKGLRGRVLGGGCATFSQHDIRCWDTTWYADVLEAEYSWGHPAQTVDDELKSFTDKFAAIFYDAHDPEAASAIASAYRELDAVKSDFERNNYLIRDFIGEFDTQDVCYTGNDLDASLKLIDDLAAHPKSAGKTVADIRQRCEHALSVTAAVRGELAAISPRAGNSASMHYLMSAPRKMEHHARLTLLLLEMSDAFRTNSAPEVFSKLAVRCHELQSDTQVIVDELSELTPGAQTTGYPAIAASLAKFEKRLQTARILEKK